MNRIAALFGVLMVLAAGVGTSAQGHRTDESAIRQRLAAYAAARTKRDAHAEALCYTEDGDFRSSAGPFVTERARIEQQLTVADPNYRFELDVVDPRFVDERVAIEAADLRTGVTAPLAKLVGTYVMVKRDGK